MTKTFLQIQKQIEQLQKEAEHLRKKEADGVLSRIKEAIAVYGFTAAELGVEKTSARTGPTRNADGKKTQMRKAKKSSGVTDVPKFKDDQGNVWSGRGPRPVWFKAALEAGKTPDELLA